MKINFKLLAGVSIGTFLEFYDFVIFIILTPIMAPLFFPAIDAHASLLASYAAFAMSFLMRPLGGYFFGAIGDRYGRPLSLTLSMSLMGGATFVMACLPTYETIGFFAPLLLIFCRLVQGFSAGGEYSGAALLLIETTPQPYHFRVSSFIPMAAVVAVILGSQFAKIWALDSHMWGWRIPFFIGAFIAFIGLFLRKILAKEILPQVRADKSSLFDRKNIFLLLKMTCLSGLGVMVYYTFATYLVVFLTLEAGWPKKNAYEVSIYISVGAFILMYPLSYLADKVLNPWQILRQATLVLAMISPGVFYLLSWGSDGIVFSLCPLLALLFACFVMTNALTSQVFPTSIRFRAMAFTYTVGASIFGGTAPMIYTYLMKETGWTFSPGLYLSLVSFLCFFLAAAPKTHKNL